MRNLDDYQQKYKDQPYERYQVYFRKKKIKEILSLYTHDILLEIGCGLDPIYNDVETFKKLYIAEPADLFFKNAEEEVQKHSRKGDISIVQKTIENCIDEFKKLKFNFVILSSLLHEITDQKIFLSSLYQIASPQTVIHINVPNAKSFHRLLAVEMGLIKNIFQKSESNVQFQQHSVFDMESLSEIVETSGFKIIDRGSYSFKPFTHLQMENMIQANFLSEAMLEGFYKMGKYMPDLGSEIFVNVVKE